MFLLSQKWREDENSENLDSSHLKGNIGLLFEALVGDVEFHI